jgi:aldose 1-epimerase
MKKLDTAITRQSFGVTKDGVATELFTLTNTHGVTAKLTTYGATLTQMHVPDRNGQLQNVVLGFDNVADYEKETNPHFGGTVGRYANRIAGARFTLDGTEYTLVKNDRNSSSLHGGPTGFDHRVWKGEPHESSSGPSVTFTLTSEHLEEGFPGKLEARVTYTLTDDNELKIDYEATTDRPTHVNLTHHSYFNLSGAGNGDVLDHELMIDAKEYTPIDELLIPTGQVAPVKDTVFDFTAPTKIGLRIHELEIGYDHNFVVAAEKRTLSLIARATNQSTGRVLSVFSEEPGVQLYTGFWLDGTLTGNGGTYNKFGGFCLEPQHFPDSPNQPQFPSTVVLPGDKYTTSTVYAFSTC